MSRLALATAAALGLLLTGCGTDSSDAGGAVDDPTGEGPALPQGSDEVVLRIETAGGYVPLEYAFAGGPTLLVTGDGTVIQPAPVAAGGPPAALLGYEAHRVDEATLGDLAALASAAGLLGEPPDYQAGAPQVTDMPSTTVTLTADGSTWTHSAYALGFEDERGARADLADFVDDALDLLGDGEREPYQPAAVRLHATPAGGDGAAWPAASVDLARVGNCAVVDDPGAVAEIAAALAGADQGAVFRQGGRAWSVTGAAVLPGDDRPCTDW